jgi:glucokinase
MAVCGIDLGGTKCLGVVLDDGETVGETRVPTPRGSEALVAALVGVVETLASSAAIEAVGIGAPGLVDRNGTLGVAPNLAVEPGLELRALLGDALGMPVVVDNDATCAAWGERAMGAARGWDDVILVTLGTGIGGGIITDGRVHRGHNGFAGEVGHMIVDPDGPRCPCGQRGCWERYASGSGLGRLAREAAGAAGDGDGAIRAVALAGGDVDDVRGEHVTAAAAEGDPAALAVLDRFGWWTALGLANLTNVFDPEAFVLGGGLIRAGEALLAPTRAALAGLLFGAGRRPVPHVVAARLGEHAGAVGAAFLAAEAR